MTQLMGASNPLERYVPVRRHNALSPLNRHQIVRVCQGFCQRHYGLALGRHVEGFVDAYYGPPELAQRAASGPPRPPAGLESEARDLLADLEAGAGDIEPGRRRWLAAGISARLPSHPTFPA